ncbi:MAG: 2-oxoacid:acceptor oxidoreductase family protein [Thermodesulfobacteriota bacterium]
MTVRTIFAGFGGQGVLLMGYVLAHGAMHKGLNLTYLPAYGAEMRGGTANCTVTISEEEIASPVASEPDVVVAMNYPSLVKFEPLLRPGGLVLLNSSLIPQNPTRTDVETIRVPTVELAREVGSDRAANMVMVGAFITVTGLLTPEEAIHGMEQALKGKEKFFPLNRAGIERGAAFIRNGK